MAKYYKGTIQKNQDSTFYVGHIKWSEFYYSWNFHCSKLPSNVSSIFKQKCEHIFFHKQLEDFADYEKNIVNNFYDQVVNRKTQYPIIYERVTDCDGLVYGKELLTGLLFPLSDAINFQRDCVITCKDTGVLTLNHKYYFTGKTTYSHHNYAQISYIVTNNELANQNDIEAYKRKFHTSFNHHSKLQAHAKTLQHHYNTNIFHQEPVFETKQPPIIPKSPEVEIIQNIEFLLVKLSNHNPELFQKRYLEYQNLLADPNLLKIMPSDFKSLKIFEHRLQLDLSVDLGHATNICDYLTSLKQEYLSHFLANDYHQTNLTLNDLDKLYENFLLISADFNLLAQSQISRDFSLIYLLEVKENLPYVTTTELSNSYFSHLLKSILVAINALNTLGLIDPISIELNHQLTLENVLHIIETLNFKKCEPLEVNTLIKKLS